MVIWTRYLVKSQCSVSVSQRNPPFVRQSPISSAVLRKQKSNRCLLCTFKSTVSSYCFFLFFNMQCMCVCAHASVSFKGHGSIYRQSQSKKSSCESLHMRSGDAFSFRILRSFFAMHVRVRVHVRGRLHSLNSTVIDMGVRHCLGVGSSFGFLSWLHYPGDVSVALLIH